MSPDYIMLISVRLYTLFFDFTFPILNSHRI